MCCAISGLSLRKGSHKLAIGLDMTASELLDFPEMNEPAFDDE